MTPTPIANALIAEFQALLASGGSGDAYAALQKDNAALNAKILNLYDSANRTQNYLDTLRDIIDNGRPRSDLGVLLQRARELVAASHKSVPTLSHLEALPPGTGVPQRPPNTPEPFPGDPHQEHPPLDLPPGSGPVSGPAPGPPTGVPRPGYEVIFLDIVNSMLRAGTSPIVIQNQLEIISQLVESILWRFGTRQAPTPTQPAPGSAQ